MEPLLGLWIWNAVKAALVGMAALYLLLVLTVYTAEGPRFGLRLEAARPFRSAERLLVWLGVQAVALTASTGRATLEALYDASADVGTWLIDRGSSEVQQRYKSRFL